MAHVVMAYVGMASTVMAYIVMVRTLIAGPLEQARSAECPEHKYRPNLYGP